MQEILKQKPYDPFTDGNEDVYFAHRVKSVGGFLATPEQADSFSVESFFGYGSFGCHAIGKWLSKEDCKKILTQYERE